MREKQDCEKNDKIQAFDALFTTNHIQIYKLLLPYLAPSLQRQLAVYIKYLELQYTAAYCKHHPFGCMPRAYPPDASCLYREIQPYCSYEERQKAEELLRFFSTVKNAEEMAETVRMMKELFPEGTGDGENSVQDLLEMFKMFSQ